MTSSNVSLISYVPPPPGLNYVAAIEPSLSLLIIGAVCSSILIPIGIALFFFSTPAQRTRPIFILNVISIAFGLIEGAFNIYNQTCAILTRPIQTNVYIADVVIFILIPIFSESILLLRVIAVYPPRLLSQLSRVAIYGPISLIKVGRLVNDVMFAVRWAASVTGDANSVLQAGQASWTGPFAKIEWFLMLFDTSYMSLLFLLRLREGTLNTTRMTPSTRVTTNRFDSYASRLKALFWIAVSNFVLPVILTLVQLIYVFRDTNFFHGSIVFIVNTYVQIIGVLLATIWVTGTHRWYDDEDIRKVDQRDHALSTLRCVPNPDLTNGSASESRRGKLDDTIPIYDIKLDNANSSGVRV